MASRLLSQAARSRFVLKCGVHDPKPCVFRGLSSQPQALTINNDKDLYKEGESQPDYDDGKNEVEKYAAKMHEEDASLVYKSSMLPTADPVLPKNPAEVAALDPAHDTWSHGHYFDGAPGRIVHVRQLFKRPSQAPSNREQKWTISFMDEGELGQRWENSLMGWKSGADPMHNIPLQIEFDSAKEAVYFAKKRGWNYVVEEPSFRPMRFDNATYQDNFLPQRVAFEVMDKGVKCDIWARSKAGASHYFRPLKYHGDGPVGQHGPNPDAPIDKDTEPYFKLR